MVAQSLGTATGMNLGHDEYDEHSIGTLNILRAGLVLYKYWRYGNAPWSHA